ncbi:MAG: hypothetical protein E6Q95_05115 [Chitinophagaceae bacterium]|nr:MAG: hypothetical protein E6Q95_05115 [Chitinophagaceae bacterium]
MCTPDEVTFTVNNCKSVSGTIWDDVDGDAVQNNGEAGTNNGGTLWVNLVGPDNKVVQSVQVDNYGNYVLTSTAPVAGDYKIIVSNNQKNVGDNLTEGDTPTNDQKYSGTNIDGTANTGTADKKGVVTLTDFANSTTNTVNLGIRNKALSVSFGAITASIVNGNLVIDFSTLNETNNSRFEIEASTDGKNFTKIGEVISQSKEGNSTETIQYSFSKNAANATAVLGFGLLAIGGLGLGFKRNRKLIFGLLMLVGTATAYTGCTKNDAAASKDGSLFIRIVQVDKDGGKSYSKVVKVNQ